MKNVISLIVTFVAALLVGLSMAKYQVQSTEPEIEDINKFEMSTWEGLSLKLSLMGEAEDIQAMLTSIHKEPWRWTLGTMEWTSHKSGKVTKTVKYGLLSGPGTAWISVLDNARSLGHPSRDLTPEEAELVDDAIASWRAYQLEKGDIEKPIKTSLDRSGTMLSLRGPK